MLFRLSLASRLLLAGTLLIALSAEGGDRLYTNVGPPGGGVTALAVRPAGAQRLLALGSLLHRGGGFGPLSPVSAGPLEWDPWALLASPIDGNRVWYVTYSGNVFRSDDGGVSFTRAGSLGACLKAVSADPRHPDRLLVLSKLGGGALHQTADGGRTWIARSIPWLDTVYGGFLQLVVLPGERLVVLSPWSPLPAFQSTDSGLTWRSRPAELPGLTTQALSSSVSHPETVYASAWGRLARSTDGGVTFQETGVPGPWLYGLTVDARDPNVLFSWGNGLRRSSDAGHTFLQLGLPENVGVILFAQDPALPDWCWAVVAGQGLLASNDGGVTFRSVEHADPGYASPSVAAPSRPQTLYAAFRRSTDGGATWSLANGLTAWTRIVVDPRDAARLVGWGYDSETGVGRLGLSTDGGGTFRVVARDVPSGLEPAPVHDPGDPSVLLYTNNLATTWRSTDSGSTFEVLATGQPSISVNSLIADASDPASIWALTWDAGIARTTDRGASWCLTAPEAGPPGNPSSLAVRPGHPATLFAGTTKGLFRSTDSGATWAPVWQPDGGVGTVVFAPGSSEELFVATSANDRGQDCYRGRPRLYRSTDGGASFVPAGLSGPLVTGLHFLPGSPRTLLAPSPGGIFSMTGDLVFGDSNADGNVDVHDLVVLAQRIVGSLPTAVPPFLAPEEAMDADLDDDLDVTDLVLLAGHLVGNVPSLPVNPIRTALAR